MLISLFAKPLHLFILAAALIFVIIPAAIALRVWMRE